MSAAAAAILERAINHARNGQRNPHVALILAGNYPANVAKTTEPLERGEMEALLAVMNAVGAGTVCGWFMETRPTPEQTAALLEEALFQVQMAS